MIVAFLECCILRGVAGDVAHLVAESVDEFAEVGLE